MMGRMEFKDEKKERRTKTERRKAKVAWCK